MVFKGTTGAYKRMENGMFLSEIGSGFKEPDGTPPPRILRSTPPRTELPLSNISFDTHARINEIIIANKIFDSKLFSSDEDKLWNSRSNEQKHRSLAGRKKKTRAIFMGFMELQAHAQALLYFLLEGKLEI